MSPTANKLASNSLASVFDEAEEGPSLSDEDRAALLEAAADPEWGISVDWGRAWSLLRRTRTLLDRVDAVICVGIEEYEAARCALPRQRIELIPGGVDAERFAHGDRERCRATMGIPADRRVVLCPARIDEQKDQLTLVQAWRALPMAVDLVLAGPETTQGYLERLNGAADGGGILVPPRAIAGWTAALVRLLDDDGAAAALAVYGREAAQRDHSWDLHVRRTLDLYRSVGARVPSATTGP